MNLIERIHQAFNTHLETLFTLGLVDLEHSNFCLNTDPNKQDFGHINSNIAMVLAKELSKAPRQIAELIASTFTHEAVEKVEIAGPGFLNFFLKQEAFIQVAQELSKAGESFFKPDLSVGIKHFNVEFVSANPTGPLHLGHGRGGIIGDVLANVLSFLGHSVTREFYINDAGAQIEKLGLSFKARCYQELGQEMALPEGGYQGHYLVTLAQECIAEYGKFVIGQPDAFFQTYAKDKMLAMVKGTLAKYGITFDVWFSEKTLHTDGSIEKALGILQQKGFLYEQEGALWFKATEFGDDKDRVVRKSDGEMTYVAADIAYMKNKIDRGADHLIMVLGHDHHGYVNRLQALLKALNLGNQTLEVILYQLVKMKASGQLVRMSKRAGNIVTLDDVIDVVGTDVARYFYLNRKADAQLEFDLDLALKKTEENPVYYVQYAFVRTNSILSKAQEVAELQDISATDSVHLGIPERILLIKIVSLKGLLETISKNYQTHLLTYYLHELAQEFHAYYSVNRVINPENVTQSRARLFLIMLLRNTFETGLTLLKISRPEKM